MQCPNCQSEVKVEANYCGVCGVRLAAEGSAVVVSAQQNSPLGEMIIEAHPCQDSPTVAPQVAAVPQVDPVYPTAIHLHYPNRERMTAPVPSAGQVLWEGKQSFWFYVPGIVWALSWFVLRLAVGSSLSSLLATATARVPQGWLEVADFAVKHGVAFAWGAYGLALLALWGVVRRILEYFNFYCHITSQRIKVKVKEGIFSQKVNQIELFRMKDAELEKPLLGRIFGYAHLRLLSSDRFVSYAQLSGLPIGENQLEMLRFAAQRARAESGTVTITE